MKTDEARAETKYIRELKKEIAKLRRENASLRKKTLRLEHLIDESEEEQVELEKVKDPALKDQDLLICPECKKRAAVSRKIGPFMSLICTECGHKHLN